MHSAWLFYIYNIQINITFLSHVKFEEE